MSGLIGISSSGGGSNNASPIISNLRVNGKVGLDNFTIKYTAEDFENTILRHYISINGQKKEITKELGYETSNNEFTYTLSELEQGTNYNVQIEVTDGINVVNSSINVKTLEKPQIYGVRVMENNSNPSTCCTYIEDAVGVNPANSTSLGGWENKQIFRDIRIVGFKNGQVTKEIKKENKTQYIDGTTVPTDVDVMVEIPKVYWKFISISNGYELRISNTKIEGSDCYAHKVGGVEKDYIYVGAYLGYVEGNKLRSRSGVSPTTNTNLTNFRNYAHNVGSGYQQWNWFTLLLLQNLYLIAYKNLNSQQALGQGVCSSSKTNTGGTNTKGMIFGSQNQSQQVCFLGIEDFYGNLWQWVDGMFFNGSQIMVCPDNKNFNDNRSGFISVGNASTVSYGRISKVIGTSRGGFFPMATSGSDTTYYCDCGAVYSGGYFGGSGGYYSKRADVGAFYVNVYWSASDSYSSLGSRLVFLG